MSRKNIFEIARQTFDLSLEIKRIRRLFEEVETVYRDGYYYTLVRYVRHKGFSKWPNRGHCIDVTDYLSMFDLEKLWSAAVNNPHDMLILIEIVYDFWYIALHEGADYRAGTQQSRNFVLLKTIMDDLLAHFNYIARYFRDSRQLIVIEDKPGVTAVAEIVQPELSCQILRYNHYLLKGNLEEKRSILVAIGADLEPKRAEIVKADKSLDDIFFLLNNLHLRHNNTTPGDKNFRQVVADMDDATLEAWYDDLYQMMLQTYLKLDQVDISARVVVLKQSL